MARRIVLQKLADVPKQEGFNVASKSISVDGAAIFLYVESEGAEEVKGTYESGVGIFPKTRMEHQKNFRLAVLKDGMTRSYDLPQLDVTFPLIDLFPDGKVLVVAPRSQWRSADDFDMNATVIDLGTMSKHSFLVGDGIEASFVDALGRVWVSYFDEGIFGNFGWGHPGPEPIGASGLNCFDQHGKLLWSFPVNSEVEPIDDCYAMNVFENRVMISAYSEFALCRISDNFELDFWTTELSGSHQFAATDTQVLFTGQYDDAVTVGYMGTLSNGSLQSVEVVEFALSGGDTIDKGQFIGRRNALHYIDDEGWYRTHI